MIIHLNKETDRYQAIWEKDSFKYVYDCTFSACGNPCCTCNTLDIKLTPVTSTSESGDDKTKTVVIDVENRSLGESDTKRIIHEDQMFSEMFFSLLDEDDFNLLLTRFQEYKYLVSEDEDISFADITFDYHDIEVNGTMVSYNDIFPYGKAIRLEMDEGEWLVYDLHCVVPGCNCTQVYLEFMRFLSPEDSNPVAFSLSVDHKKMTCKAHEFMQNSPWHVQKIKQNLESLYPDFYALLASRQKKLKAIYAQSKQKHAPPTTITRKEKIGRNDPCPCGSGKKYKKCCMT